MVTIETIKSGPNAGINEGSVVREIPLFSVKYRDVFSLRNLYVMMHELLLEEGVVFNNMNRVDLKVYGWEEPGDSSAPI